MFDSKNTWASFDAVGCEDTVHSTQVEYCKDSVDADFSYKCELMYEHLSGGTSQRCCFTLTTMGSCSELMYCMDSCNGAQNSFGCISLRKAEYCILNKQYSKEEYEALMPRIIEHMKSTGEWGEYFPARLSPIPYNDTQANNLVPLDRETVLNLGWKWRDDEPEIVSTDGEGVRRCTLSGRPFKLVPQEVKFYKQMGLPEPDVHPELRQKNRLDRRNPYRLKSGQCKECSKSVWTDRKEDERIFCHDCYLAYMY